MARLRPDEIPDTPRTSPAADLRDQPWYQFQQQIQELLETGDYDWARDTLEGIAASVEKYRIVTEGQRLAVKHIEEARQRTHWSRRYEGYRRQWRDR